VMYAATTAVVAGLSLLAFKMFRKKTTQIEITLSPAQPKPAQAAMPENAIKMIDARVQTDSESEEAENKGLASQVQDLEKQLKESREQAKRKYKDKQAFRERGQASAFVRELKNDDDVLRVFDALKHDNYERLSPVSRISLMLWSNSMRLLVIDQLKDRKKQ